MFQNRSFRAWLIAVAIVGAASTTATPAQAQVLGEEEKRLLTTLFLGTTASLSIYMTQALTDRVFDKVFADAHRYMRENAVALQSEVSMGAGPVLEDLADIYRIPEEERLTWRDRVREQSDTLRPLLRGDAMTVEQAQRFTASVLTQEQMQRLMQ